MAYACVESHVKALKNFFLHTLYYLFTWYPYEIEWKLFYRWRKKLTPRGHNKSKEETVKSANIKNKHLSVASIIAYTFKTNNVRRT